MKEDDKIRQKEAELFEYNCQLPTEREEQKNLERSKFSDLIEDIDMEDDPYYLKYYRSFHNHELDTNIIEHQNLVLEEDLHRKGAITLLPQGALCIQYYTAERRREIIEEGTVNQFRFPFDHKN